MNETKLLLDFEKLKLKINATYSAENKTIEEIYRYVQAMRKQIPANPHDFHFLINPVSVCAEKDIFLLVYVHTAPGHIRRRMAIRETWGKRQYYPGHNLRLVFLMGMSMEASVQAAISMESDLYGDIVQENFVDSYRNLTYKAIMAMKWISRHCPQPTFVLKTDDDIFVNMFNLVSHLDSIMSLRGGQVQGLLLCLVWYRMKVVRDPKSKWYLPRSEFADDYFPTYCSGSAYILSPDVVARMYNASLQTPFFWVDDFYITGLLAQKLKIEHQKFNSVYVLGPSTFLEKFTEKNKWRTLVFGHVHNLNFVNEVWKQILDDRNITLGS